MRTTVAVGVTLLAALAACASQVRAQSVLERTPNLSGGWVGETGTVRFHLLHRFFLVNTDPGENETDDKVVNTPTFLLAVPLPGSTMVGMNYASNSQVIPGEYNEWEFLGRWAPLTVQGGSPLDLAVTGAYNKTAGSGDAELSASVPLGRSRLLGTARYLSDAFGSGEGRWAVGGGAVLRLSDNIGFAGDAVVIDNRKEDDGERLAWGAALQIQIPTTPHTFSLQATNTRTSSLQGSSVGDRTRWGFEFTIPLTVNRYIRSGRRRVSQDVPSAGTGSVEVVMTNTLTYEAPAVRIRVGQSVTWKNTSVLIHTVTADPAKTEDLEHVHLPAGARVFDSGDIAPGESFTFMFEVPGEYTYFCVPHGMAGMVGRVIVEG